MVDQEVFNRIDSYGLGSHNGTYALMLGLGILGALSATICTSISIGK